MLLTYRRGGRETGRSGGGKDQQRGVIQKPTVFLPVDTSVGVVIEKNAQGVLLEGEKLRYCKRSEKKGAAKSHYSLTNTAGCRSCFIVKVKPLQC